MALRSYLDGALFAEVYGDSPPRVLALHGWGRRGSDFRNSLDEIPALAPDLPGFGASPPPTEVIGAEGYADIVAPLLDEFDEPALIVGHSFGGRIAVCLGARFPEKVGPIIITGAPIVRAHMPRRPPLGYRLMRSLNNLGLMSDKKMEEQRRERGSADYVAATGVMRDVLVKTVNESYEQQLRDVVSQVWLLWGALDREVPVSVASMAHDIIAESGDNAHMRIVDHVGHLLPTEAPEELRHTIDSAMQ